MSIFCTSFLSGQRIWYGKCLFNQRWNIIYDVCVSYLRKHVCTRDLITLEATFIRMKEDHILYGITMLPPISKR